MPDHADEPLGLLIAAARQRIKRAVAARAARHGVTALQLLLVVGLVDGGDQSLHELASRSRTDDPTASRGVQSLVSAGLVAVLPDAQDRRRSRLVLTDRGHVLGRKLALEARELRARVERDLTPEEGQIARLALRKIIASMEGEA